jgi:hypothetical protein
MKILLHVTNFLVHISANKSVAGLQETGRKYN